MLLTGGEGTLDLGKLELGLLLAEGDELEAALDVVQEAEALTSLGDGQDVCGVSNRAADHVPRYSPMRPAGYVRSVRALPSTSTWRSFTIHLLSAYVRAYFRRLRMKMMRGRLSRSL